MYLLNLEGLKALSLLWSEFVKEVRWHWENSILMPNVSFDFIDLNHCLIHQKLQMVHSIPKLVEWYYDVLTIRICESSSTTASASGSLNSNSLSNLLAPNRALWPIMKTTMTMMTPALPRQVPLRNNTTEVTWLLRMALPPIQHQTTMMQRAGTHSTTSSRFLAIPQRRARPNCHPNNANNTCLRAAKERCTSSKAKCWP